jgi:hypothetical protein
MSKLQSTVALSTAEAEANAGVEALKQVMHTRLFLRELRFEQVGPSTIYEDNNAAISLAYGKEHSKRAQYALKVQFLSEQFKLGTFRFEKVGTADQLSDEFTKAQHRDLFRHWMGVQPHETVPDERMTHKSGKSQLGVLDDSYGGVMPGGRSTALKWSVRLL